MKPTRKLLAFLLGLALLLMACQVSGLSIPGSQVSASTAAYVSQENGVTVHYPDGWTTRGATACRATARGATACRAPARGAPAGGFLRQG